MAPVITKPKCLTILMAALLLASSAQSYTGVVSIDSFQASPGEQVAISVHLNTNDAALAGLIIPLRIATDDLTIDSVSFAGSMLPADFDSYVAIDNSNGKVTVSYIAKLLNPIPTMTATDGLVATLHAALSTLATPGSSIAIDSVNIDTIATDGGPPAALWNRVHGSDASGNGAVLPQFLPGAIMIKEATDVDDDPGELPATFSLSQNYPNPFNPSTMIEFALPQKGPVRLDIYNILGQSVTTLIDRPLAAGRHQVQFDAAGLPSGIYFYRLTHSSGSLTRKMTLIK